MSRISELQNRRRNFVNNEFSKRVSGTHMSNSQKTRLMKSLWREAKRRYK